MNYRLSEIIPRKGSLIIHACKVLDVYSVRKKDNMPDKNIDINDCDFIGIYLKTDWFQATITTIYSKEQFSKLLDSYSIDKFKPHLLKGKDLTAILNSEGFVIGLIPKP